MIASAHPRYASAQYNSVFRPGLFAGQLFWVTGGGSGIGRCVAHELASLGATVLISGRTQSKLDAVAAEITQDGGVCHTAAFDIRDEEAVKAGVAFDEYYHYAEPSWNEYRINNINQHFVTAFTGIYLKQKDYNKYLDLPEQSNPKTWNGFKPRTSTGLELLHAVAK